MTGSNGDRREALGLLAGGGILAAAVLAANRSYAAETEVDLDKVPRVVKAAADKMLEGATWLAAIKLVEDDKTAYELDGTDAKKREVTVLVAADGKAVECETELKDAARVPQKVLGAIKAKWPRFEPTETHEIRQGENLRGPRDGDFVYDLRGTIAKGRFIQVQVTADGTILESTVELPGEKVPAAVTDALKKARPRFEVGTAYAIREGENLIGYHFEVKGPKGRDLTISVTPDGKQVEVVE